MSRALSQRFSAVALLLVSATCAAPAQQQSPDKHAHRQPLSVDEHAAEAERHNRVADREEAAAATSREGPEGPGSRCGGDPVEDQSRIGGEPIRFIHPCFTSVTNPTAAHLREARENRAEAVKHRRQVAELTEAEERECRGLEVEALEHSPFSHHEDILAITALEKAGVTLGVVVTFKPVRGLSAKWLERSLQCHQARAAALGYPTSYMAPDCLSAVRGAEVEVTEREGAVSVAVSGSDGASAAAILGRALGLQAALMLPTK